MIKKEDLKVPNLLCSPSAFILFRIWVHDPIIFDCGIQIGFHELRTIRLLAANGLQDLSGFCSFQRLKNDFPTEQPVEQESKRTDFFHQTKVKIYDHLNPQGDFLGRFLIGGSVKV